ncbi:hypothetical protein ILUMI_08360 [Ignelater luminosus]|uniref:Uncharacterized protein n=1 Tax=Ignelater luminosus TaxID=2038154 RepID=A0A8K0D6E6_IGNLU|nr:hypothetical protein ILUMI_08360 [Ignelater luminosus]
MPISRVVRRIKIFEVRCVVTSYRKMFVKKLEQRIVIKYLVKSGPNSKKTETCVRLRMSLIVSMRLKAGRESVEDDERQGASLTVLTFHNIERLRVLMATDRRQSIRMLSVELGINKEAVC